MSAPDSARKPKRPEHGALSRMRETDGPPTSAPSMPSLDTNVLLRWLLNDVPAASARAERLIASGDPLRIEDAALIEVVYVLETVMRSSREAIRDTVRLVISTGNLDLDRPLWNELADVYVEHPKLSAVDVYLALRARENGVTPLLTFDRKLASQLDEAELLT
ncbi:MAG: PIN domain-containing protein [Humibacter sp.]